jgi:mono/diheme cytochrome c family protein
MGITKLKREGAMNTVNRFLMMTLALFCSIAPITACSSKGGDTGGQTPQSAGITRHTFLNAKQIVSSAPPVSFATGTASMALDTATGRLTGTVTLSNATIAVTAVRINDSDAGSNGELVVSLVETPVGSGKWAIPETAAALTAAQSDRFKAAGFYVSADTSANPFGEIRGQLLSYGDNIQPVFDQHCTACHTGGQSAAAGLPLDRTNSYAPLVNQPARQSSGTRVIPFDAANSVLFRRISGIGFTGTLQMPPNGQLSAREVKLIEVWINMGALDDNGVPPNLPVFQGALLTLRAFLNDKQTVSAAPVLSAATGSAIVTLDAVTGRLTGTVTLSNVTNAVTAVHINDGDAGSAGALVISLNETPPGSGSWTFPSTAVTAAQMARFKIAGFYVGVDTTANPNGEIRGQLLSYADNIQPIFSSNCINCHNNLGRAAFVGLDFSSGASYAGLVNQPAVQSTGARAVPFDAASSVLLHRISGAGFAAVVGPTMPPDYSNLPPLPARDQNLIKVWLDSGAMDTSGVVRPPQPVPFRQYTRNSTLSGRQVVPIPVISIATGTAAVVLDTATSKLTGTVVISNMTVTAVHINDGDADSNGALVVTLAETLPGSGIWTIPAIAPALSDLQMNRFIAAGLYISADTSVNPNGEIRGQLQSYAANVQPVLTARCVTCHSFGIDLRQGQSYATLVDKPSTFPTGTRVIPSDAANSVLYRRIIDTGSPAGFRMPVDGTPFLPLREENIIKTWINMGARND